MHTVEAVRCSIPLIFPNNPMNATFDLGARAITSLLETVLYFGESKYFGPLKGKGE